MLITGYCVKAGSIHQGLGPEYVTVNPPVASMTITHSSTKDVSHYSFSWSAAPTFDYTPSLTVRESVCTLVDDVWTADYEFSATVTGQKVTKGTPWTAEEKAAEDAKLTSQAQAALENEESDFDIDRTGDSCDGESDRRHCSTLRRTPPSRCDLAQT